METDSTSARLCLAGKQAELEGRAADALALFQQAWDVALDNREGAIAAHHVAQLLGDPLLALPWHQRALDAAYLDQRSQQLRAELHVSLGACYAALGAPEAQEQLELAAELDKVPRQ